MQPSPELIAALKTDRLMQIVQRLMTRRIELERQRVYDIYGAMCADFGLTSDYVRQQFEAETIEELIGVLSLLAFHQMNPDGIGGDVAAVLQMLGGNSGFQDELFPVVDAEGDPLIKDQVYRQGGKRFRPTGYRVDACVWLQGINETLKTVCLPIDPQVGQIAMEKTFKVEDLPEPLRHEILRRRLLAVKVQVQHG